MGTGDVVANLVELELATNEHFNLILPLVSAYHEFEGLDTTDAARESSVQTLLSNRALGGIWLVYSSGEPAGYIALCVGYSIEFGGHDAFVDEFFIRPEFRGKGLGTEALELIKAEATNIGIKALHLEVAKKNAKAKRLYSRSQFQAREKYVLMSIEL